MSKTTKTTRAEARAREAAKLPITAGNLRILAGHRRKAVALVDVAVGPLTITMQVAERRGQRVEVSPPRTTEARDGVTGPVEILQHIEAAARAAVEADDEAAFMVLGWTARGGGGTDE